ncbi:MAG: UPF0149 family protein [Chromatiales bacterium]|nr:UPF0149 family protein [Chromatiales bacterium]
MSPTPVRPAPRGYEELAGFVFTIARSPGQIRPSDWLPMVFNDQDANYATLEEAQEVLGAVMALYNFDMRGPPRSDCRPAARNRRACAGGGEFEATAPPQPVGARLRRRP